MNDLQVVEIIDKFENLIIMHQRKCSKYASLDDFKSEIFLRIKDNIKDDERTHFSYIKLIAQQVASEQYRRNAFVFTGKRGKNSTELLKERNDELMNHLKKSDDYYLSADLMNIDFLENIKGTFSQEEFQIIELLSRGYNKNDVAKELGVGIGVIYSRIKNSIEPRLKIMLYGNQS